MSWTLGIKSEIIMDWNCDDDEEGCCDEDYEKLLEEGLKQAHFGIRIGHTSGDMKCTLESSVTGGVDITVEGSWEVINEKRY